MEALNWDILLHELESGKCILCVGPDVFSQSEEDRIEKKLAQNLRLQSDALGIRVYDDGWFHYLKDHDELGTWFTIRNFYEQQLPNTTQSLFADIASLPLHLILNFSPDYRLRDAFKAAGKPHEFACLYKNPETDKSRLTEIAEGIQDKPLIFNMLGEIEDKDSLVMTFDDFFSYMAAIFEYKRMPQHVKLKIQNATHFIFLGMPLDKWYFHLFMRVLNMHRARGKSKRFAASYTVDVGNATFCEEQYTLTFVQDNILAFTSLLKLKWQAYQTAKSEVETLTVYDQWRNFVKTGEDTALQKVFKDIKPHTAKDSSIQKAHLLLEMQWNGFRATTFETEMSKNAMKTQIIKGILGLIEEIGHWENNS